MVYAISFFKRQTNFSVGDKVWYPSGNESSGYVAKEIEIENVNRIPGHFPFSFLKCAWSYDFEQTRMIAKEYAFKTKEECDDFISKQS